jgi:copper chaperone CopZ
MKSIFFSLVVALAMVHSTQAADVTVKINNVHLCCDSCVKGASNAVYKVDGATANIDKGERMVEITGSDTATVQKAADALIKAGYFGESSDPSIKMISDTGAKGSKVQSLKVEGVHLCCPKCVKAVRQALQSVPGVTGDTAQKKVDYFMVTGDFNDGDVFAALQKIGLTGKEASN